MNAITNMFTDRVFGGLLRFVFDRLFGNFFKNNVNFNNIDLRKCDLKDLTFNAEKINEKFFKQTPFRFFNGSIRKFNIKLPPLSNLINESIEITVDGLDLILVFDSVDYSNVDRAAKEFQKNESTNLTETNETNTAEQVSKEKELDVYKKIINRVLLNMKIKVTNLCVRVLSEKPIVQNQITLLPQNPCLLFKVGSISLHKIIDTDPKQASEPAKDTLMSSLIFSNINNYHIQIKRVSAHMLARAQLEPTEFLDMSQSRCNPKAEFPFEYPTHSHPSTFLALGFGSKSTKKAAYPNFGSTAKNEATDNDLGIYAELILTNDRRKRIKLEFPQVEVMLDFLVIRYMSRYVEKALEWKKAHDYLNYRKQKYQNSDEYSSRRRNSEVILRPRDNSGDNWVGKQQVQNRSRKSSEMTPGLLQECSRDKTVKIGGCEIDINYFESLNLDPHDGGEKQAQSTDSQRKDLFDGSEQQFQLVDELKRKGVNVETLNEVPDLADTLLDSSNIEIYIEVAGVYVYVLKTASTFLRTEFKRRWLYDELGSRSSFHKFNSKIPVDYFLLKLTHITFSGQKLESQLDASLTFSNLKLLDVLKVDRPQRNQPGSPQRPQNYQNLAMSTYDLFQSIMPTSNMFEQSMRLSKKISRPSNQNPFLQSQYNDPQKAAGNRNILDSSSMLFVSARDSITAEFLEGRQVEAKKLIDWEIDGTREHFCVNYLFKFNTNANSYKKQCRIQDQKSLSYAIYQPFNSTAFEDHIPYEHRPTIKLSLRSGEVSVSADLPAFYCSFYMKIVLDVLSILHNSSDAYFFIETQYQDFKREHWQKWQEEANQDKLSSKELEEWSRLQKDRIDTALEEYWKTQTPPKIQASFVFHFGRVVFLGEHECDLGDKNIQNDHTARYRSFEGTIAQYFEEAGSDNSWDSLTIFSKKALILDIAKTICKFRKGYGGGQESNNSEVQENIKAQILLNEVSMFYPSEVESEYKKIKMSKLFSLSSRNKRISEEVLGLVCPSITFRSTQTSKQENINLDDATSDIQFEESDGEESKSIEKEPKRSTKQTTHDSEDEDVTMNRIKNKVDLESLANQSEELATLLKKYKGFRSKTNIEKKENYFKYCEGLAAQQITLTIPLFEVYLSNNSINFLMNLLTRSQWYFKQIDEQLKSVLKAEAEFFEEILTNDQSKKKQSDTKGALFISCKVADLNFLMFEQRPTNKSSKNDFRVNMATMRLDDSVLDRSIDATSQKYFPKVYEDAHFTFDKEDYYSMVKNFMSISIRDAQTALLNLPSSKVQIIHLDINNIFVADKSQLQPEYGSHIRSNFSSNDRRTARSMQSQDFEGEYDQHILLYKQGSIEREGLTVRPLQEIEFLSDLKLNTVYIIPHDYAIFNNTASNIFSFAFFSAQDTISQTSSKTTDVSVRLSKIGLRSDLELRFVEKIKKIIKILPESIYKPLRVENNVQAVVKNPSYITLDLELNELMVDILPYIDYEYYILRGPQVLKVKLGSLDPQSQNDIFYTNYRLVLALRTTSLNAKLSPKGLTIKKLELMNVDCLLKNSKQQNVTKNPIILRSSRMDGSLFDSEFDEMRSKLDFRSNPVRLSSMALRYTQQPQGILDISMKTLEISLCSDTILSFHKLSDIIKFQLNEGRHRRNAATARMSDELDKALSMDASRISTSNLNKQSEMNNNQAVITQPSTKPQYEMNIIEEEIELDLDFYKDQQQQASNVVIEDDDGFAIIDDERPVNFPNIDKSLAESMQMSEAGSFAPSSYKSQTSFISSNTVRFDEENMHNFALEQQKTTLRIELKLTSLKVKLLTGREFEPEGPQIIEHRDGTLDEKLDSEEIKEVTIGQRIDDQKGGISLSLENLVISTYIMEKNPELRTNAMYRIALSCEQLEIVDLFDKKLSNIHKILTKHHTNKNIEKIKNDPHALFKYRQENKTSIFNFIDIVAEVFSIRNSNCNDWRFFVGIHPIQINFNTHHYKFLKNFSKGLLEKGPEDPIPTSFSQPSTTSSNNTQLSRQTSREKNKTAIKKGSIVFIPLAQISNFDIYLNFDVDYSVFNLEGVRDVKLEFKRLTLRAIDGFDKMLNKTKDFYTKAATEQIKHVGIVLNLPIARNLTNLVSATFNMIYLPYEHFKDDKGVTSGLVEGVGGFAKSVATEGLTLTEFLTNTVANVASLTGLIQEHQPSRISRVFDSARTFIDPDSQSNKHDKYKK